MSDADQRRLRTGHLVHSIVGDAQRLYEQFTAQVVVVYNQYSRNLLTCFLSPPCLPERWP
jgi:hypothetical protein